MKIIYESGVNNHRKNYKIKWKINKNNKNKRIWSDIIGDIFVASYYNKNTKNRVELILFGIPSKQQLGDYCAWMKIEWKLNIKECNLSFRRRSTFDLTAYFMSNDNFTEIPSVNINEYTLCIDINILGEYD